MEQFIQLLICRKDTESRITPLFQQSFATVGFPLSESHFRQFDIDTDLIKNRVIKLIKPKIFISKQLKQVTT